MCTIPSKPRDPIAILLENHKKIIQIYSEFGNDRTKQVFIEKFCANLIDETRQHEHILARQLISEIETMRSKGKEEKPGDVQFPDFHHYVENPLEEEPEKYFQATLSFRTPKKTPTEKRIDADAAYSITRKDGNSAAILLTARNTLAGGY